MGDLHQRGSKLLTPGMQRMLFVAGGLVFAMGTSLYFFSTQTDRYFAWTIQSALTAAFLGGACVVGAGTSLAMAAVMTLLGVVLLIAPAAGQPFWPWALTPLAGRAIGAWLVALGLAAGQGALENDLRRVRPLVGAVVTFSLLQFLALARFGGEFDWGGPRGWLHLAFLTLFLAFGLDGWRAGRNAEPPAHRMNEESKEII